MSILGKPKILLIATDYYPMESANISIIRRISSHLSRFYDVTLATQKNGKVQTQETESGINIIRVSSHNVYGDVIPKRNGGILNFIKKTLKYVPPVRNYLKSRMDDNTVYYMLNELPKLINIGDYDAICSFCWPFLSHRCAGALAKKYHVPWIAYYVDPFFPNATFDTRHMSNRKNEEETLMSVAAKVVMAYPTNEDYLRRDVAFGEKIVMTEMPGIVYERYIDNVVSVHEDCGCYFIGNLYKDIRNPESVIKVFSLLSDKITMFFVGGWYGDSIDTRNLSSANVQFLGSKKEDEISAIYGDADILVNIGNAIDNQMPSKIFEYISTGKPILNVYKVPNCPTLKYLRKYPLALNIFEDDLVKDMDFYAAKIQDFCLENKGKRVPLEFIMENYQANTDENVAEFLRRQIDEVLEGQ